MSNIRIISVRSTRKGKDELVIINYQTKSGKSWSKTSIESPEKARPEFYSALEALAEHVIELCECPVGWLEHITVTGATFNYKETPAVVGATITAHRKMMHSNSPMHISTPFKFENGNDAPLKGDGLLFLTPGALNDLRLLREECKAYVKGERAQQSLFSSEKNPPTAEEVADSEAMKPTTSTRTKKKDKPE